MCPVGKLWSDVLEKIRRRRNVTLWPFSTPSRPSDMTCIGHRNRTRPRSPYVQHAPTSSGCAWSELERGDAAGVALVIPMKRGSALLHFWRRLRVFGTSLHSRGLHLQPAWRQSMGIEFLGQLAERLGERVDFASLTADLLQQYPSRFSPAGVDFNYNILPFPSPGARSLLQSHGRRRHQRTWKRSAPWPGGGWRRARPPSFNRTAPPICRRRFSITNDRH